MTDPVDIRAAALPPELLRVTGLARAGAFASPGAGPWVRAALLHHGTLYRAAARDPEVGSFEGRGPVYVVPGPGGRVVVRRYHRGGALAAPLLGDRHLRVGTARPVAEARVSAAVRRRGLPTPPVVAGAVYPAGPFYRADLVTTYIPDSVDLAALLFGRPRRSSDGRAGERTSATEESGGEPPPPGRSSDDGGGRRRAALKATGRLVARMAGAGVEHQDLNAGNVLVRLEGATPQVFVLDLDWCRLRPWGEAVDPVTMIRRLKRSLKKLGGASGRPLTRDEMQLLRQSVDSRPRSDRDGGP